MSKRKLESEIECGRKAKIACLALGSSEQLRIFVRSGVFNAGWPANIRSELESDYEKKNALVTLAYLSPSEIDYFNSLVKVVVKSEVDFTLHESVYVVPFEEQRPRVIKDDPLMALATVSVNQLNCQNVVEVEDENAPVVATVVPSEVTAFDVEQAKTQLVQALLPTSRVRPEELLHSVSASVALMKTLSDSRESFGIRLGQRLQEIFAARTGVLSATRAYDELPGGARRTHDIDEKEAVMWEGKIYQALLKVGVPDPPESVRFNAQNFVAHRRRTLVPKLFREAMKRKLHEISQYRKNDYAWSYLAALPIVPLLEAVDVDWSSEKGSAEIVNRLFTTQKKGICVSEVKQWHTAVVEREKENAASYIEKVASLIPDYVMGDHTITFLAMLEDRLRRSGEEAYYASVLLGSEDLRLRTVIGLVGRKVKYPAFPDFEFVDVYRKNLEGGSAYLQVLNKCYPVKILATVSRSLVVKAVSDDKDVEAFLCECIRTYVRSSWTQMCLVEAILCLGELACKTGDVVHDVIQYLAGLLRCIIDAGNYDVFDGRSPGIQAKEVGTRGVSPLPSGEIKGFVMGLQGGDSMTHQYPKKGCYYYVAVPWKDDGTLKLRLSLNLPSARWRCDDVGLDVYKVVGYRPYRLRAVHTPPHYRELWTVFRFMMPTRDFAVPVFAVAFDDEGVLGWIQLNDRSICSEGETDCVVSSRVRTARGDSYRWHLSRFCNPRFSVLHGRTLDLLMN